MDKKYLELLDTISYTREKAERAINEAPYKEFEDKKAYKVVERLLEQLQDAEHMLKHWSIPTKEGVLWEDEGGKFVVQYDVGGSSWRLSCGDRLEVFLPEDEENDIDAGWNAGQVEYKDGYIFLVPGRASYPLYNGMKVRLRL